MGSSPVRVTIKSTSLQRDVLFVFQFFVSVTMEPDCIVWYNEKKECLLGVPILILYLQMLEAPEEQSKFEQLYLAYRDLMFYIAKRREYYGKTSL